MKSFIYFVLANARRVPLDFDDFHTRPVFTSSAKARSGPKPREGVRVHARSDRVHMAIRVQQIHGSPGRGVAKVASFEQVNTGE